MKWKKYAGAAMAAAMIPALVAPIATEAASDTIVVGLDQGKNIVITLDGKLALTGEESVKWFSEKQIKLVSTENKKTYYPSNGIYWVDATPEGINYDIFDVTGAKKGSITVYNDGSTKGVLDYSAEVKAEAKAKAEAEAKAKAEAEAKAKAEAEAKAKATSIVGVEAGFNIKSTLDGQLANNLIKLKGLKLVNPVNGKEYSFDNNGLAWVPATSSYTTYDICDVFGNKKGSINVSTKGTTGGYVNFSSVSAANVNLLDKEVSMAYFEKNVDEKIKGFFGFEGIIMNDKDAKLRVEGKEKTFKNTVTAHAASYGETLIKYDLNGKNVNRFSALVGQDERRNIGAVEVEVRINGKYHSKFVQKKGNEAKALNLDLTGAKTLEFVITGATDATNPNQDAVVVFGDPKFY